MAAGTVKDNLHTPPPHPKPFNIRLPPSGKIASLLIGDSNLQRVDQRRLDPTTASDTGHTLRIPCSGNPPTNDQIQVAPAHTICTMTNRVRHISR
nr:hypothetical protein BaRGS_008119 [Batillaria attramentaria]